MVVLLDGAFEDDGVEVTIGFLDGFFVITEIGFLVLVVLIGAGLLVLEAAVTVGLTAEGVVVRSLLTTDWNVVNSCISSGDVVLSAGTSFLMFIGLAVDAGANGTVIVVVGLLEDGRLDVVEAIVEPVPLFLSSFCCCWTVVVVVVGSLVESVAKTVVPGVVGFLLLSTPEETLIISKLLVLGVAAEAVVFWLVAGEAVELEVGL